MKLFWKRNERKRPAANPPPAPESVELPADFDPADYLAANPDVARAKVDPVDHYLRYGKREGRPLKPVTRTVPGAPVEDGVFFSIVTPTYNRADRVCEAIDSALAQTYREFEVLIVDDGSTDGTEAKIAERYAKDLASGRVRYFRQENKGVCAARNRGLKEAKGSWIAYLDSDNRMMPWFLRTFADAIRLYRSRLFYADWESSDGKASPVAQGFDPARLLRGNYIDLGVFVHARELVDELGGFDEMLTRLVDWDLVLRYTRKETPVFLREKVMWYNNGTDYDRISTVRSHDGNRERVWEKNRPERTIVIPVCAPGAEALRAVLEKALVKADAKTEVLVVDDNVPSDTMKVVYAAAARDARIRVIRNAKPEGLKQTVVNGRAGACGVEIEVVEI